MIRRAWTFTGGTVRHLERLVRRDGTVRIIPLPARFALIEHRTEGRILFDTGYHPSLRTALRGPAALYHRLVPWRCDPEDAVLGRLSQVGLTADDVDLVVLSHLHADHVAGLVDLPNARIGLTRTAWDHLQRSARLQLIRQGYFPEVLPDDLLDRAEWLPESEPTDRLDDCAIDWFGDGSVGIVPLPGHAPGQIGLSLRGEDGTRVLLVADATFSLGAVSTGALPSRLFRHMVFHDDAATRATLGRLQAWSRQEPELRIVPAHAWELDDGLIIG